MVSAPIPILMFEDDEGQAILTKEALERDGFIVDVCQTGHEGLASSMSKEYQAYLIDMRLPDIQGIEVLRRLKAIKPRAVSIIVTGYGNEHAAVEAMKAG